jgi:hypothetical protein
MSREIAHTVSSHEECQFYKPSQQKLALIPATLFIDLYPMAEVGADLYECEKNHYLILVDQLSGFSFVHILGSQRMDTIIKAMVDTFALFGRQGEIRVDNGPCSRRTSRPTAKKGIMANNSSPYKSSSNRLAEKAIHVCKKILHMYHSSFQDWNTGMCLGRTDFSQLSSSWDTK